MGRIVFYLIFAYALWLSWQHLFGQPAAASTADSSHLSQQLKQQFAAAARSSTLVHQLSDSTTTAQSFHCDGRQYCGQMHSRAEAEYFNQHCPNTKMDGDHDGIPCERDSRW